MVGGVEKGDVEEEKEERDTGRGFWRLVSAPAMVGEDTARDFAGNDPLRILLSVRIFYNYWCK